MAKHIVKCKICGKEFDLSTIQGVKCGNRRYAHLECFPEGELVPLEKKKVNEDEKALKDYIQQIYGDKANWTLISKQIKEFLKQNYTYRGMKTTLMYFYEVKHNSPAQSNGGIGIIPYVYQEAFQYYYAIWEAQQQLEQGAAKITNTIKNVVIKPPQPQRPRHKIFKFLDN